MLKRLVLMLALAAAFVACGPSGTSPTTTTGTESLPAESLPAESPSASPS